MSGQSKSEVSNAAQETSYIQALFAVVSANFDSLSEESHGSLLNDIVTVVKANPEAGFALLEAIGKNDSYLNSIAVILPELIALSPAKGVEFANSLIDNLKTRRGDDREEHRVEVLEILSTQLVRALIKAAEEASKPERAGPR